jgi:hypothetical protein
MPDERRTLHLDARGRRLRAALAAVLVRARAPELTLVHRWLDSWAGIGLIVIGMGTYWLEKAGQRCVARLDRNHQRKLWRPI